jgi:hypothetical protein
MTENMIFTLCRMITWIVFLRMFWNFITSFPVMRGGALSFLVKLVLLWAQLTKIYPPLPTSVQPISITKTLLIVPTKNERDPPLFTGKLVIKFQNILRNTIQVIIRHRVKIIFSVISSPITLFKAKQCHTVIIILV